MTDDELLRRLKDRFPGATIYPEGGGGVSVQHSDRRSLGIEIEDGRFRVTPTSASTEVRHAGRTKQFATFDALCTRIAEFLA